MRKNKVLYIDMDDVMADFYKSAKHPIHDHVVEESMFKQNFFLNLEPVPGSKAAIFSLMKMGFDVWVLTQPLVELPESYIEKAKWIQEHFPQLHNKLILTQDKGLHLGHYLIDDNLHKWQDKFEKNGGKFIHFPYGGYNIGSPHEPTQLWKSIVEYLKQEDPYLS